MKLTILFLTLVCWATASAETVTVFGNGAPPQASSSGWTNTYSTQIRAITNINPSLNMTNYFTRTQVRAGEVLRVLSNTTGGSSPAPAAFTIWTSTATNRYNTTGLVIVGPVTFEFMGEVSPQQPEDSSVITVSIQRIDEPPQPNQSVVIPADTAGSVNVFIETSTNLASWQPAAPGLYGARPYNQYFRVRAVRNN